MAGGLIFSVGRPRCGLGPTGRCSFPLVSEAPSDDVKIRAQVYKDPRPPEHFDRFHERTRTRSPDIVYEIVRVATTLYSWILFRVRGIDASASRGGRSSSRPTTRRSWTTSSSAPPSAKVQFMAKSQLFKPPMQFIYTHGGVFPVRRGHRNESLRHGAERSSTTAAAWPCTARAGARARAVGRAQPGIGRWRESGAMIVPVAIHGSSGPTGRACSSRRSPSSTASRFATSGWRRRPRAAAGGGRADLRGDPRSSMRPRGRGWARRTGARARRKAGAAGSDAPHDGVLARCAPAYRVPSRAPRVVLALAVLVLVAAAAHAGRSHWPRSAPPPCPVSVAAPLGDAAARLRCREGRRDPGARQRRGGDVPGHHEQGGLGRQRARIALDGVRARLRRRTQVYVYYTAKSPDGAVQIEEHR